MEHAIEICEKECYQSESTTCESSDAVHAWDAAVAYYMGTHRPDDINTGMMMFHATERRCRTFRTCGEQGNQTSGAAYVNQLVFKNFIIGQRKIIRGDCNGARNAKEIIVNRMSIPLVQGAIQHAYSAASSVAYDEKSSAEASAFTFSILPIVHECNEEDALLIHRELNAKKDSTIDFQAVKSAFERNYQCMNIQCDDVGGIYDHLLDNYKFGAEPCKASAPTSEPTTSHSEKESSRVKGITMGGVSIGVATLIAFLVIIVGAMIATKDVKAIEDAPIESEDPIKGDSGSTLMFA